MTWFRVDDSFADHPKVVALADGPCRADAIALWTLSGSWVGRWNLEGFISNAQVRLFGFHKKAPDELVRVGLWAVAEGGYRFHDWLDRNPSRKQVEAGRAKTNARVTAHRKRQGNAHVTPLQRRGETPRETVRETPVVTPRVTSLATRAPIPDPDPDPRSLSGRNSAEIGEVVASSDRARAATTATSQRANVFSLERPSSPPDESSQNFTSAAAGIETLNGDGKLSARDASATWNAVMGMPNAGVPGAAHPCELWRSSFETIACACNGVEGRPALALRVVIEWFWLAPAGPVQTGRIKRPGATPEQLAKRIVRDLEDALSWWQQRKQQQSDLAHKIAD